MLRYLIRYGGADPNATSVGFNRSPMHLSIFYGQVAATYELMACGGDIHRKLRLGAHNRTLYNNTTPLEYLITSRHFTVVMIEWMLAFSPLVNSCQANVDSGSDSDSDAQSGSHSHPSFILYCPETKALLRNETLDIHALSVDYVRAACKRHRPDIFRMLFRRDSGRRLDPNMRDGGGNTPLALFCAAVEAGLMTPQYTADLIAARTACCVRELLALGADTSARNNKGVTALDRVRRIMDYAGVSAYRTEIARAWNEAFAIEGDCLRDTGGGAGYGGAVWGEPLYFP